MRLSLNSAQSFATLASLFLIVIPLVTYLRYSNNAEILKVAILMFINLNSIIFFLNLPSIKIYNENKSLEFSPFRLSILSLFCLLPLLFFVGISIQGYDLLEMAIFSEQYRQGAYSGSGIYTAWSTQILSLIIFVILITNGPSKSLIIPVSVVVISSLILGLRVFLWGLFVGYFFAIVKNLNLRKILLGICFIFLFISYKYILNPVEGIAAHDLFLDQLTRPDLHAIVKYEIFSDNLFDMLEYFPYVRYLFGHDTTAFKDFYVPSIPNLSTLMPYISLNSGVALPGHVINYNFLFILALIPNAIILSISFNLIILMRKTKKILLKFLCAYLFLVISIMFLEDVNVLYKLEQEIVFILISYFLCIPILTKSRISGGSEICSC